MECAKRVKVLDKTKQRLGDVSISKILKSEGKGLVKACEYICLGERCGVRVWPVIPLKVKPGRQKSPQAHFRASKKHPHKTGCNAKGTAKSDGAPGKQHAPPTSRHKRSRQGAYPTRYTEFGSTGSAQHRKVDDEDSSQSPADRHTEPLVDTNNASIASTALVRKLVEIYENPPGQLSGMPLDGVPDCPGRDYATVFRAVGRFAPDDRSATRQFIYYGEIESLTTYSSGTWVRFSVRVRHGRGPLGVWISDGLEPRPARDELLRRIQSEDARFRLYALGVLEPKFSGQKYSIEVTRLGRVWVSLKGENQ